MSELILPDYDTPAFVQGRRLKPVAALEEFFGCVIVLRNPSEQAKKTIPMLPTTKAAGMMQTLSADPLYHKRAKIVVVLSPAAPGAFLPIPVEILEASDPVAHPPGMPEQVTSLLEE